MKLFTALFFPLFLISLSALNAQDANSVPLPETLSPGATPQPGPTPLSLIPNTPEPVAKPSSYHGSSSSSVSDNRGAPSIIKKNKTLANTDDIADRIKFREAKTKALQDEKIQSLWSQAQAAKTDEDKRGALKQYYTELYAKILKINGSLKKLVSQREKDSLKQLDQHKVRPEEYPQEVSASQ